MSELLKNKMLDYELPPPATIWGAVSQELADQRFFAPVARKLSDCEIAPPAESWQHILSGLGETTPELLSASAPAAGTTSEPAPEKTREEPAAPVPVKNIGERAGSGTRTILRWVAAATISAVLLAGSYYFINSIDTGNDRIAGPGQPYNGTEETNAPAPVPQNIPPHPGLKKGPGQTSPPQKRAEAVAGKLLAINEERPLRSSPVEEADPLEGLSVSISPGKIFSKTGELIQDMSVVNPQNSKYISITAPNGQQTRISAKLAIAMPYLGPSESDIDQIRGSYYWKHLIHEWQEKIMQSDFVPSSLNFLDILEFSELIRD